MGNRQAYMNDGERHRRLLEGIIGQEYAELYRKNSPFHIIVNSIAQQIELTVPTYAEICKDAEYGRHRKIQDSMKDI